MTIKQSADEVYFAKIKDRLLNATKKNLNQEIVNAPFCDKLKATVLDLGVVVLLLVNEKTKTIDRIALSDTEQAKGAQRMSVKPFKSIKIPLNQPNNIISQAIKTGEIQMTDDWFTLFVPVLTSEEAHFNQIGAGIECSVVHPLKHKKGAIIFSYFQPPVNIGFTHLEFMKTYVRLISDRIQ